MSYIEFKDVGFAYASKPLFTGLNLSIRQGEKIAVVGPTGSGKSSLIRILLRFYNLDAGSIEIKGQDIAEVTRESLWRHISLVSQDGSLFHGSIKYNVRYGRPDATDEEVIRACKLAHCHECIMRFEDGYDTIVGDQGKVLSGGERQRINIARAILRDSPILILDESTSALDYETEALIQAALDALLQNKTAIIIAHRLSTIRNVDRILVMKSGEIVEEGNHTELIQKNGHYARLWSIQSDSPCNSIIP